MPPEPYEDATARARHTVPETLPLATIGFAAAGGDRTYHFEIDVEMLRGARRRHKDLAVGPARTAQARP